MRLIVFTSINFYSLFPSFSMSIKSLRGILSELSWKDIWKWRLRIVFEIFSARKVKKSMHMYWDDDVQSYNNNFLISFLWEISAHNVSLWMNPNVEMKEKKENFSSHSLEMFMYNGSGAITLTPRISRAYFPHRFLFSLETVFFFRFQRDKFFVSTAQNVRIRHFFSRLELFEELNFV